MRDAVSIFARNSESVPKSMRNAELQKVDFVAISRRKMSGEGESYEAEKQSWEEDCFGMCG